MSENTKCEEQVSDDSWHFHDCGRPTKYRVENVNRGPVFVCGVHAAFYRRRKFPVEALLETARDD